MGYHALITLDFAEITDERKALFYKVLVGEQWSKVRNQASSWKVSFQPGVTRTGAIDTLENDLQKAKEQSTVARVDYAIQLDTEELRISNLQS